MIKSFKIILQYLQFEKNLKKMKKSIAINKGLWYSIKRSCREGQANENFKKNQKNT